MTSIPKRSSRQRRSTKPFEYHPPPELLPDHKGSSVIDDDLGGDSEQDELAAYDQATDEAKLKPHQTHGEPKNKKALQQAEPEIFSPLRKRARLSTKASTISDLIISDGAEDTHSDKETCASDNATEDTKATTPHRTTPSQTVTQITHALNDSSSVVELWYADPYQRHRPDVKTYDVWCRDNLESSLREQGLFLNKAHLVLAWLVRCRTHGFQPLGSPKESRRQKVAPSRKRSKTKSSLESNIEVENDDPTNEAESQIGDVTLEEGVPLDDETDEDEISVASSAAHTASAGLSHRDSIESTPQPLPRSPEKLTFAQYNDLSDEEKIRILKSRLKVFDIVYGKGEPKSDLECWDEKLDYFSPVTKYPRSVPKGGFRTQGHSRPQIVTLPANEIALRNNVIQPAAYAKLPKTALSHGLNFNQTISHSRGVLTEDPNFGITRYPAKETETPEGLEAFNSQRQVKYRSRKEIADDCSKTVEEIRQEEAETAEAESEKARKALRVKHWDWETPDAMKGLWVDVDAGKTTFDPNTFGFGPVV